MKPRQSRYHTTLSCAGSQLLHKPGDEHCPLFSARRPHFEAGHSASLSHSLIRGPPPPPGLLLNPPAPRSRPSSPLLLKLVASEKPTSLCLFLQWLNNGIWVGFDSAKMVLIPGSFLWRTLLRIFLGLHRIYCIPVLSFFFFLIILHSMNLPPIIKVEKVRACFLRLSCRPDATL